MESEARTSDIPLALLLLTQEPGTRSQSPHDVSNGPLASETPAQWSDKLQRVGASIGIYRACSVGWHEGCSCRVDGPEAACRCLCHDIQNPNAKKGKSRAE